MGPIQENQFHCSKQLFTFSSKLCFICMIDSMRNAQMSSLLKSPKGVKSKFLAVRSQKKEDLVLYRSLLVTPFSPSFPLIQIELSVFSAGLEDLCTIVTHVYLFPLFGYQPVPRYQSQCALNPYALRLQGNQGQARLQLQWAWQKLWGRRLLLQ